MRKYLASLAVAASALTVLATDARIETMGGHQHFFKDDQSIFYNPATIAAYDDLLMGSFGVYVENAEDTAKSNLQYNRDALKPYFGGTISFGDNEEKKSKFTIGAVMNRYDPLLDYVTEGSSKFFGYSKDNIDNGNKTVFVDKVVAKTDLITGVTLNNGITLGLGGYLAFQKDEQDNVEQAMTRVVKGTFGMSGAVSDMVDLEASVGVAALTLKGYKDREQTTKYVTADNDIAVTIDVRAFAAMEKFNGAFVPHIQANIVKHHIDETLLDFNGGIGFNANIDRGFFWAGFEGIYEDDSYGHINTWLLANDKDTITGDAGKMLTGERSRIGGRISFGIERNILTDWLVWRVGGQKVLAYEKLSDGNVASYWVENPEDDHVSFGMGVNIEDRFKVDAVVAENLLYTFSNLFSGNSHHFSTKISATFAF